MADSVMIPLIRDSKDIYYRYKMPKLTAKIEGSGNGIKTVITNMSLIAKALNRPPTHPTKYFGYELGTQVTMNEKSNEFIVNGVHDADKLQTLLYNFISKFVLCENCQNPETNLEVVGKKITQACIACSYRRLIPTTTHRLTAFIISHSSTPTTGKKQENGGKKSGKMKKNARKLDENENQLVKSLNGGGSKEEDNCEDDDFGSDDLTEQAYEERMRALTEGFSSTITIKDSVERANEFFRLLNDKKDFLTDQGVQKSILNEAIRLGLREKGCLVLCEVLFTENIIEEINKNKILLLRFCADDKKAQKYLLGGLEKLVADVYKDKLYGKAMTILKLCYDLDILDEDVLIEWSGKPSKKYISKDVSKKLREKIQPFIKWLKEAEIDDHDASDNSSEKKKSENEDDDDDDDDDLNIEYSHRVNGIQIKSAVNDEVVTVNGNFQNDNDLNIDEI